MKSITVQKLVERLSIEVLSGKNGLFNTINNSDHNSPGLELTGFLKNFPNDRIQIIGKQEMGYINTLGDKERKERLTALVEKKPPCFIITRGLDTIKELEEACDINDVPLLRTEDKTTHFIAKISNYLDRVLAEELTIHAVCLNVFGLGIILRGNSGIGKSETALSLLDKGHRLIADDAVKLKKIGNSIIGTHEDINKDFLSIRGIGLVNIARLYGASSVQEETRIVLDITLAHWDENKQYNPLQIEESFNYYLGIKIKSIEIPIRPGRDISTIIELAVNSHKLEQKGYNALDSFNERLMRKVKEQNLQ